jgi:hypothetical protein
MADTVAVDGADGSGRLRTANAVSNLDHKAEHLTRLNKIEGQNPRRDRHDRPRPVLHRRAHPDQRGHARPAGSRAKPDR